MKPPSVPLHALVLGISNYERTPLTNPVRDAKALEKKLLDIGYNVTSHFDNELNDLSMMEAAIDSWLDNLPKNALRLVFFSGHGLHVTVKGDQDVKNFLEPRCNDYVKERDLPHKCYGQLARCHG